MQMKNFKSITELNESISTMDLFSGNTSSLVVDGVEYKQKESLIDQGDLCESHTFLTFVCEDLTVEHPMLVLHNRTKYFKTILTEFFFVPKEKIVTESEIERPTLGNTTIICFPEIGKDEHEAKIDTGAEMSCLHAENIKVSNDSVTFEFHGSRITMNCNGSMDIKTADNGVDSRPVITLRVTGEENFNNKVEFNLNDRSEMPHQILLGKNFLQAGNFLIDPLKEATLVDDVKQILVEMVTTHE